MIHVIAWLNAFGITPPWAVLSIFGIAVFGVGRLARLITYDAFPPSIAVRIAWARWTSQPNGNEGPWTKLFTCYWCLTPWLMLVALGVLGLSWDILWLAIVWLVGLGWLALSYITSMIVNRDERDG